MNALTSKLALGVAMAGSLAIAGCATPYNNGGNYGYQGQSVGQSRNARCDNCGVVQEVQQVYTQGNSSGGTLGAVIGAVAGGVLGNQVGKGDGRKAATLRGPAIAEEFQKMVADYVEQRFGHGRTEAAE